jgi:hypothetical protein
MLPNIILSILYLLVDVHDPLTVSAFLVDLVLQIATFVVFPVSLIVVLFAPLSIARVGAIIASICSALLGISASLSALQPPRKTLPTILAVVCAVIGVALLLWLTHKVTLAFRWRVSIVGLLSLLPLIQFWHETSFLPARLQTSMSVTRVVLDVRSETESERRGSIYYELQNLTDVDALILTSHWEWCFRPSDADLETTTAQPSDGLCSYGQLVGTTSTIHGKVPFVYQWTFSEPKERQFFQLFVTVEYARNDRLRIDYNSSETMNEDIKVTKADGCSGELKIYPILDEARFQGLVQKQRYLTYDIDNITQLPRYHLTAKGEPWCVSRGDLDSHYGITTVTSRQRDWLPMSTSQVAPR